ncbi:hypothetical protein KJ652_06810 [Patescibacteria group bacterium]|nr:hypothetical protein [Patescibacteria group bacterium]MBU1124260.1 hypothetical protein [Patescibacteria group bacterium]
MSSSGSKGALLIIILIGLIILVFTLNGQRQMTAEQLERVTIRLEQLQGGGTQENQEKAKRITRKVRILMDLGDVEPTVATIVDVTSLRKQNSFYNKAENGDFLIVTPERAILYNEEKNRIIDVVPVQIKPNTGQ